MIRLLSTMALVTLGACTVTTPVEPCADVSCGDGRCVIDQGAAACLCAEGFRAEGLRCVKASVDVCDSISCTSVIGSRCVVRTERASCECPDGAVAHAGSCVVPNPCLPNPCTRVRRTTCEVINGGASCRCDLGYAPEGDGCSAIPLWTCNTQHSGADEDDAEPDECPPLASTLTPMVFATRNLAPLGDHDWFRVTPYVREITWFEATSADPDTALIIEIFNTDGTQLLAADNRGLSNAGVGFVSTDGAPVLARVRALGASAAGGYTASYRSLGFDDFADREDDAEALTPNASVFGATQFPGDVDLVWLELPAQLAVELTFTSQTARLEVRRDGMTVRTLRDADRSSITSAFAERLLLVVTSEVGASGSFAIHTSVVGVDDHAADGRFATLMTADGTWFTGNTEHIGDVDSLSVPQVRGRTYVARWNSLSASTVPSLTVSEVNGARITSSAGGRTELAWKAVSDTRAVLSMTNATTGTWQLAVTDLGPDDHADDVADATPISLQQPVSGVVTLDADVDTFVITPTVGHILRATVTTAVVSTALNVVVATPSGHVVGAGRVTSIAVTEAGPHFISVRAPSNSVTPYTLVVTDDGADDHGATPTPLPLDTWADGVTQFIDDVDTFSFAAAAGNVYRVLYEHDALTRTATVRCNGTLLVNSPMPATALLSPSASGTCEVRVSSPTLGAFRVRVEALGPDDHPHSPSTAAVLPGAGRIEFPRDRDVFRVDAVALRGYRVNLTGAAALSFDLQLLAADGTVLLESYTREFEFSRDVSEAVYVAAFIDGNGVGDYQLTLTELSLDDHPGTSAGATPLALGTVVAGVINYVDDVDTFAVTGPPQRHLRARCLANLYSCAVGLRSADGGTPLGFSSGEVFFRATPGAPTTWLDVSSGYPTPYTFEVTDVGADDVGDLPSTAAALSPGPTGLERALEVRGDIDTFRIAVNAGDIVKVQCTPLSATRCFARVLSPLGVELSGNFRAALSGDYLVEIFSDVTGSYRVSATLGTDDHGDTTAAATALTVGQLQVGSTDYETDVDFFSITIGAGQRLNLETAATCRIRMVTPTGGTAASTVGDSLTYFAVNAGTHFVALSDCDDTYSLLAYF